MVLSYYHEIFQPFTFVYCVVQTRWIVPETEKDNLGSVGR